MKKYILHIFLILVALVAFSGCAGLTAGNPKGQTNNFQPLPPSYSVPPSTTDEYVANKDVNELRKDVQGINEKFQSVNNNLQTVQNGLANVASISELNGIKAQIGAELTGIKNDFRGDFAALKGDIKTHISSEIKATVKAEIQTHVDAQITAKLAAYSRESHNTVSTGGGHSYQTNVSPGLIYGLIIGIIVLGIIVVYLIYSVFHVRGANKRMNQELQLMKGEQIPTMVFPSKPVVKKE